MRGDELMITVADKNSLFIHSCPVLAVLMAFIAQFGYASHAAAYLGISLIAIADSLLISGHFRKLELDY